MLRRIILALVCVGTMGTASLAQQAPVTVTMAWDPPNMYPINAYVTNYRLIWVNMDGTTQGAVLTGNVTEYTITVTPPVIVMVRAQNDAGESGISNQVVIDTDNPPGAATLQLKEQLPPQ